MVTSQYYRFAFHFLLSGSLDTYSIFTELQSDVLRHDFRLGAADLTVTTMHAVTSSWAVNSPLSGQSAPSSFVSADIVRVMRRRIEFTRRVKNKIWNLLVDTYTRKQKQLTGLCVACRLCL